MTNEKDKVTIYDIAKEAAVSPATVSRIMTGSASVSPEKRERVTRLFKKYNFIPNQMARSLTIKKSKTIGMLLSDIRNPFYSELYVGVEMAAVQRGYNVILCNALNDDDIERRHMEMLLGKSVDVIFLCGGQTDNIKPSEKQMRIFSRAEGRVKIVVAGSADYYHCNRIKIDDAAGFRRLVDYLYGLGHRKFALIGGDKEKYPTAIKRDLFQEILREKNLPYREDWMLETPRYGTVDGYEAAMRLLRRSELPTAILGINELVATGIAKAASELGLNVPADLSVAAFDNTYLADMYSPTLTSVGCDYEEYGERLLDLLMDTLEKGTVDQSVLVSSRLSIRNSCAAVKQ